MTEFATSADGTRIAYDREGDGPPVVLVAGIFCTRKTLAPLAAALAGEFTVLNLDRRGRGESDEAGPYAVEREIEDLAAVIDAAGGSASVYGHSSGAGLALEAAAAGLPVERLILHEPPYGADDEESKRSSRELGALIEKAIAEDRRADAIGAFLGNMGVPPEALEGMKSDPDMLAVAPTMPYDFAVMGDIERGGVIPVELAASISQPTLLLAGDASAPFFMDTARRLAELIGDAQLEVLAGADHGAPADVVAPPVSRLLAPARRGSA